MSRQILEALDGAKYVRASHDLNLLFVWYGGATNASGRTVFVFDSRGKEVDQFDLAHPAAVLHPYTIEARVAEYIAAAREGRAFDSRPEDFRPTPFILNPFAVDVVGVAH